jgi:hypothetical protein
VLRSRKCNLSHRSLQFFTSPVVGAIVTATAVLLVALITLFGKERSPLAIRLQRLDIAKRELELLDLALKVRSLATSDPSTGLQAAAVKRIDDLVPNSLESNSAIADPFRNIKLRDRVLVSMYSLSWSVCFGSLFVCSVGMFMCMVGAITNWDARYLWPLLALFLVGALFRLAAREVERREGPIRERLGLRPRSLNIGNM